MPPISLGIRKQRHNLQNFHEWLTLAAECVITCAMENKTNSLRLKLCKETKEDPQSIIHRRDHGNHAS